MLSDYLKSYIAARQNGDTKTMRRIERDLASLGMDAATLHSLTHEFGQKKAKTGQ